MRYLTEWNMIEISSFLLWCLWYKNVITIHLCLFCSLAYRVIVTVFLNSIHRTVFWTLWEKGRVEWFGRMALKHVYYHIWQVASPGSMHDTGCLGLVHWDDPVGWYREEGGRGFRMGNMCTLVADSCWCMAKQIQYFKVKKKIIK